MGVTTSVTVDTTPFGRVVRYSNVTGADAAIVWPYSSVRKLKTPVLVSIALEAVPELLREGIE